MKDILTEIKNNLQGNNSRMDEVENQINDLEHKEVKNNQSEQEEKRILKMRIVLKILKPLGQLQDIQYSHHRGARGGEKKQEIGNLF